MDDCRWDTKYAIVKPAGQTDTINSDITPLNPATIPPPIAVCAWLALVGAEK
jgi:hypothetical protein